MIHPIIINSYGKIVHYHKSRVRKSLDYMGIGRRAIQIEQGLKEIEYDKEIDISAIMGYSSNG